jgi:hypothetical protein
MHSVAFHLIKTYALKKERSHKNVIGLVFGQEIQTDSWLYMSNVRLAPHRLTSSAVRQRSISDRTILITYNISYVLSECPSTHKWIYSKIWLSFCCPMNMLSLLWQHVLTCSHFSHFTEDLTWNRFYVLLLFYKI